MTLLVERDGNLFDSTADAYAHGVNTKGLMGAGIAVSFKRAYPEMYAEYKDICKTSRLSPGSLFTYRAPDRVIYNIASQDNPGRHARLEWVESGLVCALGRAAEDGVGLLAMPRIGCGIGGLAWDDVRDIIEHYATTTPVDIEVWTL
jgi:O-acetyl-ADP-ribose deacetylase (regulator of RNase III)